MHQTPALLSRFKAVFSRLTPDTAMPMEDLYAEDVRFEDPFGCLSGRPQLTEHFRRMNARIEWAEFVFSGDVVTDGHAALPWVMTLQMRRPRQTVSVDGVSLLQFGDRITFQRDHFDAGAMLYERLPLVGALLRAFKRSVT